MNIALIAMSGVRACDKELLRLGLTLPGFVERSKTIASLPSLGLLTLAGMTPAEHRLRYIEVREIDEGGSLPADMDLAAISTFSAQAKEAYALGDRLRAAGVKVVLGGLHASSVPEEAALHADAVMIGEGEICWPEVLADAAGGRLARFYRSRPRQFDLAQSPMPAFEMLDISRYNRLTVQTSRGCPFRCEFCASSILLTDAYKQKPIERVLAEIDRIRGLWRRPFIEFADDNSFANRPYWKRLLPELAKRRIKWFTESDVGVGQDDELLTLMRQAGCAEVLIGLESPTEAGLRGLEMKSDWKHKKLPEYERLVGNIQAHGIRVNGCFILGLDGQGPGVFDQVFDAARRLELYDVQITVQTPFPGTPLYRRLESAGRLIAPGAWERCTLFDVNFVPMGMSVTELEEGFRGLGVRLYSGAETQRRRDLFKAKYQRYRSSGRLVGVN